MTDPIAQAIGGYGSGLIAGFIGYISDTAVGAMFQAFQPSFPVFAVYGIAYTIFSFVLGVMEAYIAGVCFSLGILSVGLLLKDFGTVISGLISIVGIACGILFPKRS